MYIRTHYHSIRAYSCNQGALNKAGHFNPLLLRGISGSGSFVVEVLWLPDHLRNPFAV